MSRAPRPIPSRAHSTAYAPPRPRSQGGWVGAFCSAGAVLFAQAFLDTTPHSHSSEAAQAHSSHPHLEADSPQAELAHGLGNGTHSLHTHAPLVALVLLVAGHQLYATLRRQAARRDKGRPDRIKEKYGRDANTDVSYGMGSTLSALEVIGGVLEVYAFGLVLETVGPLRSALLTIIPSALVIAYLAGDAGALRQSLGLLAIVGTIVLQAYVTGRGTATICVVLAVLSAALTYLANRRRAAALVTSSTRTASLLGAFVGLAFVALMVTGPFRAVKSLGATGMIVLLAPFLPLHLSVSAEPNLPPASVATLLLTAGFQLLSAPQMRPTAPDVLILVLAVYAAWPRRPVNSRAAPDTTMWPTSTAGAWGFMSLLPPKWRPHLATVLNTPASRRIFLFLMVNLVYMGIQMAYGIITNSLGLISDSIHMLFDCLGLAVGLWASVAATWTSDGRYTFGYTRVETLSGFVNGCFLILISIFIIFEAIQRVLEPPEIEKTGQLLLVSSIGLAINLFGMWATGGHHHHHGHSHGHGHDHGHANGHAHGHIAVNEKKSDDRIWTDHGHSNGNGTVNAHGKHCEGHHDHDHHHDHHDHKHEHEHTHDHSHHSPHKGHHDHHGHDDSHHGHHHGHAHGHSHNMRGVFLHVMADTLGSVGVIVSTLLIDWIGWTGFDPLASLFIAGLISASVLPLVTDAARILMLDIGAEQEHDVRAALAGVTAVDGLVAYSSPRFWAKGEGQIVGSIHIQVAKGVGSSGGERAREGVSGIQRKVERALKKHIPGLGELVVQVEAVGEGYCQCMTG